jgi:hypothetical protein
VLHPVAAPLIKKLNGRGQAREAAANNSHLELRRTLSGKQIKGI